MKSKIRRNKFKFKSEVQYKNNYRETLIKVRLLLRY